jgi:hypothetical protein
MELPPEETLRWVVRIYAQIRSARKRTVDIPRLVQPDSEFFPDEFHHDMTGLERLLDRMAGYAPIGDHVNFVIGLLDQEEGEACGTGAACGCSHDDGPSERSGRVEASPGGYRVWLRPKDAGRPETLTTVLARAIGAVVLEESAIEADDQRSELAAVANGFGVLLMNGAAVWGKSCGGLRMTRATALTVEELAVALALFGGLHGTPPSRIRKHLGTTQRAAFDVAHEWVESNPMMIEALRDRPGILEGGMFDLEPVRGVIGRWLHRRQLQRELKAVPAQRSDSSMTEDKRRRLREARALVDEVMSASESEE